MCNRVKGEHGRGAQGDIKGVCKGVQQWPKGHL